MQQQIQDELDGKEATSVPEFVPEYEGLPTLDDWWPEPDWRAWVANGLPAQLAADLYFLRKNLVNRPPSPSFGVDAPTWVRMYHRAVDAMKKTLAGLSMNDTFATISWRYEAILEWQDGMTRDKRISVENRLAPFGLGKGYRRRLNHPFGLSHLMDLRRRYIAAYGWPTDPDIPTDPEWLPLEIINRATGEVCWKVCKSSSKGFLPGEQGHDDEEMAIIEAIVQIKADARDKESGSTNPYDRPPVAGEVVREGPDWRDGQHVTTEEFLKRFRLRGIQFGNWVTQKERQDFLDQAWDALNDLMDICGLPPEAASINGFIEGFAFGSRGKPGSAAHWEPEHRVLHLTRKRGAGALAHEWAHAMDNYLGVAAYRALVSAAGDYPPPQYEQKHNLIHAFLSTLRETGGVFPPTKAMMRVKVVMRNRGGNDDPLCRNRSTYFAHARQIDGVGGTYWQSNEELWARAFEAWVHDALEASARRSDFLVYGVDEECWDKAGRPSPYPLGEERAHIGGVIAAAIRNWKPAIMVAN